MRKIIIIIIFFLLSTKDEIKDGVTEKEVMHGMIGATGDSARSPLFSTDCSGAVVPTSKLAILLVLFEALQR